MGPLITLMALIPKMRARERHRDAGYTEIAESLNKGKRGEVLADFMAVRVRKIPAQGMCRSEGIIAQMF